MKVFNGKKFLDEKAATLEFSNGKTVVIREVSLDLLEKLSNLEQTPNAVKEALSALCGCEVKEFDGLGAIELKGAVDFLLESLFGTK